MLSSRSHGRETVDGCGSSLRRRTFVIFRFGSSLQCDSHGIQSKFARIACHLRPVYLGGLSFAVFFFSHGQGGIFWVFQSGFCGVCGFVIPCFFVSCVFSLAFVGFGFLFFFASWHYAVTIVNKEYNIYDRKRLKSRTTTYNNTVS